MSTPHKPPNAGRAATTPKIGRDIRQSDMSFHSSAVHQSGSKNMQSKMSDLDETFIKRKTELAELMRSTGKKRVKMSESRGDTIQLEALRDLKDFPNLSGLDSFAEEEQEDSKNQPFSAQTGSLIFDSSFVFSPGQPELNFTRNTNSAANFFESSATDTVEYKEHKSPEPRQDENLEVHTTEEDGDEGSEPEEQRPVVPSPNQSCSTNHQNGDDTGRTYETANRSSNNVVVDAELSFRSQGSSPAHSAANRTPDSGQLNSAQHNGTLDSASGDNHTFSESAGVAVAKVLTFSPTASGGGARRGFSQPPLAAVHSAEADNESVWRSSVLSPRSPLLQHQYRSVNSGPQSRSGTDEDAAELLPVSAGVRRYEDHVDEEASPSSYSNIYRDNLLHQLKVTTAKNEMLQGKLRDIEQLVDRNYGSISERSKLLTAERNKLERQRSQMEDDLVATKEELLFIRAQLQNKSARISELEMELLEAQRRLVGTSTETSSGSEGEEEDIEVLVTAADTPHSGSRRQTEKQRQAAFFRPTPDSSNASPSAEIAATLSQEEATAMYAAGLQMDLHAQQDAREIELLKNLLVEQEKKLIELQSSGEPPGAWEQQIQAAVQDNVQLLGALDAAETERNILSEQMAVLEQRVQEAEQLAFEEEARAAALELELFKALDEEHERAMGEALGGIAQAVTTMAPQVLATPPPKQALQPTAVVMQFNSGPSPCLPLRRHPTAPLRIPREGYAGLLILTAVLLATVWALLLVVGFLYLGLLEQRFGVDILSDGGVYGQLFMLRGPRALASILRESIEELDFSSSFEYCAVVPQDLTARLTDFIGSNVLKAQNFLR